MFWKKDEFIGDQKCFLTFLSSLRSDSRASFFVHHFSLLKFLTFSVASYAEQVRPKQAQPRRLTGCPAESEQPEEEINHLVSIAATFTKTAFI
ncbi:hypothetical protein [Bacillus sp. OV322]|uniref:hypothetical protein n=1 Tax=Bacillus sp. OV322 TaxID=1882764 RepID=UPI00114D4188|nr:hypothetical protein [Bacillus sp. OV322]